MITTTTKTDKIIFIFFTGYKYRTAPIRIMTNVTANIAKSSIFAFQRCLRIVINVIKLFTELVANNPRLQRPSETCAPVDRFSTTHPVNEAEPINRRKLLFRDINLKPVVQPGYFFYLHIFHD